MRLAGKTAIVTGGASGIGRAIAILFAMEGASVAIGDVIEAPREGGAPTEQIIPDAGGTCRAHHCDVTRWDDDRECFDPSSCRSGFPTTRDGARGVYFVHGPANEKGSERDTSPSPRNGRAGIAT